MRFRIYYADGSTYDGDPFEAPSLLTIAIPMPDPDVGRIVCAQFHYYWYRPDDPYHVWWGGDLFGLYRYLSQPGPRKVLFGETVHNSEYRAILRRAVEDPDFPRKSAWYPWEPKP